MQRHILGLPLLLSLTLGTALVGTACGPIEYVNQVTRKASSDVEAAKAVRADKYAPYWYTLAVEYLHKAREQAASADYQSANRFGRRSAEAARKAKDVAIENAKRPKKVKRSSEPEDEDIELVDPVDDEEEES